ncbi:MAG: VOC family protein [Rhizobiaceae bacterium]
MQRFFFNILSSDVARSKKFYMDLLDMHVHFDSEWFVILKPAGDTPYELGIIDKNHEIAPDAAVGAIKGIYPTFVVDDVEASHAKAIQMKAEILEPPTDMFYGQRRMLVRDLDGTVIDISALMK